MNTTGDLDFNPRSEDNQLFSRHPKYKKTHDEGFIVNYTLRWIVMRRLRSFISAAWRHNPHDNFDGISQVNSSGRLIPEQFMEEIARWSTSQMKFSYICNGSTGKHTKHLCTEVIFMSIVLIVS
ncbi:hypothetical protein AVEN_119518-1 [Araneus ventricosus]|uniref:Uncharacterized protein n=1 Tax=Araneus ventricosus TaxID=182803 RepID=A0A4Y2M677_ARAVE|nr:hypothetical protein AVEN_119518-1 [Araneus ventricosus]